MIIITFKSFLQVIGFLLAIKAVILGMYLLWGIQITISQMILPREVIIIGIIADVILACLAFKFSMKKK